jgi:gliding motility-associated-like protein
MQSTQDLVLWKFHTEDHSFEQIGPVAVQNPDGTQTSVFMLDIASDPRGMLYGVRSGVGDLYRINPLTAEATWIGRTVNGVGMTFTPDGRLFIYGAPYVPGNPLIGPSLSEVDPMTGALLGYVPVGRSASGDLAYDPVQNKFLISSTPIGQYLAPDLVLEIDPGNGEVREAGTFPSRLIWGFDVLSDSDSLISCSGGPQMAKLKKTPQMDWVVESTWSAPMQGCLGAARYMCERPARFTVNGQETRYAHVRCGEDIHIDAALSGDGGNYTWTVSGVTLDGQAFQWERTGEGNPGELDLMAMPEFQALQLQYEENAPRHYLITLKRWCTTLDIVHESSTEIVVSPAEVTWDIRPHARGRLDGPPENTVPHRFPVGQEIHGLDLGSPDVVSAVWSLGALHSSNGFNFQYLLQMNDVGMHTLSYQVKQGNGCISHRSAQVQVVQEDVYIPSAFTPNGDGLNDSFEPQFSDLNSVDSVEMVLFDRWGHVVFESKALAPSWDGRIQGTLAPSGTYNYVLRFRMKRGEFSEKRGQLTLL